MSTQLSTVYRSINQQQIPALITILEKGAAFAAEQGIADNELLQSRLTEDMHPLIWQVQAVVELALRSTARLTGNELPSLSLEEDSFSGLLERVQENAAILADTDMAALDNSADQVFEIPLGPEFSLSLSGTDYTLKFFLPNFYFHLTTAYNLLRKAGVDIGKRDFMGPIL